MKRIAIATLALAGALALPLPASADSWKDESGHGRHAGGPPPWAPAHGYRDKHGGHHDRDDHAVEIHVSTERARVIQGGRCNRDAAGAVFGGIVGGIIGNQAARNSDNRELATIAGAIIGVALGKHIGSEMDRNDASCAAHALEVARDGETVTWDNPDSGLHMQLTPTETFDRDGRICRRYETQAMRGHDTGEGRSEACRTADGKWEFADSTHI